MQGPIEAPADGFEPRGFVRMLSAPAVMLAAVASTTAEGITA